MNWHWATLIRAWYHRRAIRDLLQLRGDVERTLIGIDYAIQQHHKELRKLGRM
jgi:hypothetical protein